MERGGEREGGKRGYLEEEKKRKIEGREGVTRFVVRRRWSNVTIYCVPHTESVASIPISKTKDNYASVDCGAKVIATNKQAQVRRHRRVILLVTSC